jgi:hypothetical protein
MHVGFVADEKKGLLVQDGDRVAVEHFSASLTPKFAAWLSARLESLPASESPCTWLPYGSVLPLSGYG